LEEKLVMPIKRYKPEQIVTMLRQIEVSIANGKSTPQACKEAEITVQTFYRWRKEYGGSTMIVIPGHCAVGDKSQLAFYRDLLAGTRDKVAAFKMIGTTISDR
jgi:hypothetical protein